MNTAPLDRLTKPELAEKAAAEGITLSTDWTKAKMLAVYAAEQAKPPAAAPAGEGAPAEGSAENEADPNAEAPAEVPAALAADVFEDEPAPVAAELCVVLIDGPLSSGITLMTNGRAREFAFGRPYTVTADELARITDAGVRFRPA